MSKSIISKLVPALRLMMILAPLTFAPIASHADPKDYLYFHRKLTTATDWLDELTDRILARAPAPAPIREQFDQLINPQDPSDLRTFKQRYFIDSQYAESADSPVFFYICGEGACTDSDFRKGAVPLAKSFKGHMVALEHRYYGQSQPFSDLSTDHLQYLTTENALSDLARFEQFAIATYGFKGRWFSIGGSYAGALSAYYRERFPSLVSAALASSAPVRAHAAFEEYDLKLARDAGPECAAAIRNAIDQVRATLSDPVRLAEMKKLFGAEEITDPLDFFSVVSNLTGFAIQYGKRDEFCSGVLAGDPLAGYVKEGKKALAAFGTTPVELSYQYVQSADLSNYTAGYGTRQWFYQTCREFGFFYVAYHDPVLSVLAPETGLQFNFDQCRRTFGLEPVNTDHINQSLYQPLLNAPTSNILFTNGSTDPWASLSVNAALGNDTNSLTETFIVEGGSHCSDLGSSQLAGAVDARARFMDLVKKITGN